MTDGPIDLHEGKENAYLKVIANLPPEYLCEEEDCIIKIEAFVENKGREYRCPKSPRAYYPQAVIGWADTDIRFAHCGITITEDSYNDLPDIPIRAKADKIIDKLAIRNLKIYRRHYVKKKIIWEVLIKTIQLKIYNTDRFSQCKSFNDPHMTTFDGR